MALDTSVRGLLDQTIDQIIKNPPYIKECRTDAAKEALRLRTPEDFALGMILGTILDAFQNAFRNAFKRGLTPQETSDMVSVVMGRIHQIRNAIIGVTN